MADTEGASEHWFAGDAILLRSAIDMTPKLDRNFVVWLHFIGNAAALATLVRGVSSAASGERIAGLTWSRM